MNSCNTPRSLKTVGVIISRMCLIFPDAFRLGKTIDKTEKNMQEAIAMHLEGMREDGLPIRSRPARRSSLK